MHTDVQIAALGKEAVPLDYVLPGAADFILKAVNATFTDNGAVVDWLPCVTLISDSGAVIARAVDQGVKVTAGSDAEVSWFPGVKPAVAAAAGVQQLWWFGDVGMGTILGQSIPSGVWTQIVMGEKSGPALGTGGLVEFDFLTSKVRFNYDAGAGNMRFVRLSGTWPAGTGSGAMLGLRFASSGTVEYRLYGGLLAADYQPVGAGIGPSGYQELATYVTPFIFTTPGDHADMTAWAFQASGGPLVLSQVEMEVYGPSDANGQM